MKVVTYTRAETPEQGGDEDFAGPANLDPTGKSLRFPGLVSIVVNVLFTQFHQCFLHVAK